MADGAVLSWPLPPPPSLTVCQTCRALLCAQTQAYFCLGPCVWPLAVPCCSHFRRSVRSSGCPFLTPNLKPPLPTPSPVSPYPGCTAPAPDLPSSAHCLPPLGEHCLSHRVSPGPRTMPGAHLPLSRAAGGTQLRGAPRQGVRGVCPLCQGQDRLSWRERLLGQVGRSVVLQGLSQDHGLWDLEGHLLQPGTCTGAMKMKKVEPGCQGRTFPSSLVTTLIPPRGSPALAFVPLQ